MKIRPSLRIITENTKTRLACSWRRDIDLPEHARRVNGNECVKNEIFLQYNNVKDENISSGTSDIEDNPINIKLEPSQEDEMEGQSDNEFLSVMKKIKYEYVTEYIDETKENAPTKKRKGKRGRPPNPNTKKKTKSKSEMVAQVCEECGKTVKNLKHHCLQHMPSSDRKKYPCKLCDKIFLTPQSRNRHNKIKHLGIKDTCHICNKKVVSLTVHSRLVHNSSSLTHECAPCGRRFLSRSALLVHASIHTKDRPYACDKCDKRFRIKLCLELHRRRIHDQEKTHLCQFCSKSFFKKNHLQVHLRTHTKEKPYQCSHCDKSFSSSSILSNHRTTHSNEKRYECTLCNMSFARTGYLRNHMLSHTKEKRHPCKYCGVKFARSDHRKRHEHTAHERHLLSNIDAKDSEALTHAGRAIPNLNSKQTESVVEDRDAVAPLGFPYASEDSVGDVYVRKQRT